MCFTVQLGRNEEKLRGEWRKKERKTVKDGEREGEAER